MLVALGVVPVHVAAPAAARVEVFILGLGGPHRRLGDDVRVARVRAGALAGLDVRGIHVAGAAALWGERRGQMGDGVFLGGLGGWGGVCRGGGVCVSLYISLRVEEVVMYVCV